MKDSIGSLWLKQSRDGKSYMSGTFQQTNGTELQIVVFKNNKGDNPKRPDYRIFLSEPREEGQGQAQKAPAASSADRPKGNAPEKQGDAFDDDIPF